MEIILQDISENDTKWMFFHIKYFICQIDKGNQIENNTRFLLSYTAQFEEYVIEEYKAIFLNAVYNIIRNEDVKKIFKDEFRKYFRLDIINNLLSD